MSLRDDLQAALGSAFAVERELAGGGMSRVFVAFDTALGRKVVVKVLHPELAGDVTAERFAREIQLVARLQQANIVPLLSTGRAGTLPYYTMPFVEGLSLRQRLAEAGAMPVHEALGILRDVARALAYAHDAGVVHRDIKPENVLLSGGAAVVTDFGIAKAITASRTQPAAATITQAGAGVGTPAYMAPEQAAGDPAMDHRADIYGFGCLAYELLTGHPPFAERTSHELIAAHMTRTPPPASSIRAEIPAGLSHLVDRCLAKAPMQRPQSAREVLDALDAVATPVAWRLPALHGSRRQLVLAVALVVAVAIAAAAYIARRAPAPAASAGPPAIAVIPFANVGGDAAQDYLADGVSDELATAVGKVQGVRLAARSGAYRYRGQRDLDVREVGRALGVAYVVQGTVWRAGTQLRISAQLTDAATGVEVWSQSYDRTMRDVFRTEDEITGAIATALASRVRGSASPTIAAAGSSRQGTADPAAYDLYMRAEFALKFRRVDSAAAMFRGAINRDARFARAYAGLSQALALMPYFTGTPHAEVFPRVLDAASTALSIDSSLAEAWMARGMAYMNDWQWEAAASQFTRAIAADPGDVQSHFQYGRFLVYRGQVRRAMDQWKQAIAIDPYNALPYSWIAYAEVLLGHPDEAVAYAGQALEYDPNSSVTQLNVMRAYLAADRVAEARRSADMMIRIPPWSGMRGYLYAKTGTPDTARALWRRIEAAPAGTWFRHTALAMIALGLSDTTAAIDELEKATDARETWPTFFGVADPLYDPIRRSARWATLLKRVGLESAVEAAK